MDAREPMDAVRKLRAAFDLHRAGVSMMQARLQRTHPDADRAEILRLLGEWLRTRPGAPWGDTVGRVRKT